MAEPVRNRYSPFDLTDEDVNAALERIASRDDDRGRDARHVYETLTWGEGPARVNQAAVQDWLWYRLSTKYLTDEPEHMAQLTAIAAELFDGGCQILCVSDAIPKASRAWPGKEAP